MALAVTSNQPCRMPEERKRLRYSPGVSRRTRVKMAETIPTRVGKPECEFFSKAHHADHPHAGGENSRGGAGAYR